MNYKKSALSITQEFYAIRGTVRKMRIHNAKPIFKTDPLFLTTLRKLQWSYRI